MIKIEKVSGVSLKTLGGRKLHLWTFVLLRKIPWLTSCCPVEQVGSQKVICLISSYLFQFNWHSIAAVMTSHGNIVAALAQMAVLSQVGEQVYIVTLPLIITLQVHTNLQKSISATSPGKPGRHFSDTCLPSPASYIRSFCLLFSPNFKTRHACPSPEVGYRSDSESHSQVRWLIPFLSPFLLHFPLSWRILLLS